MPDHLETVPMTVDIKVGEDHELNLRTRVVKDVGRIYFTGTAVGAMTGLAKVTKGLVSRIPDDAPLEFQLEKAIIDD